MIKKIYLNGRFLTQDITGVQRYAHELVLAIDSINPNFEITLLTPRKGLKHQLNLKNIKIKAVGNLKGHAWEQFDLPRFSKDGSLFCLGNTAPIYSLLTNNVVVTVHDLSFKYFPDAYSFLFKMFYNIITPLIMAKAKKVITVSNSEKEAITKIYQKALPRIIAIQNGGFRKEFLDKIKDITAKKQDFPFGIYVGSLSKRKNFQGVLNAMIPIIRKKNIGLILIGAAQKALTETAIKIPEDCLNKIIFAGQINDTLELISWYKGAEFLAFPSFYEASPLPPIEAMSCGLPVIAGDIPSLRERCDNGALYCNPYDVNDIKNKIWQIIDDNDCKSNLIKKGLEQAQKYTWENCANQTLKLF